MKKEGGYPKMEYSKTVSILTAMAAIVFAVLIAASGWSICQDIRKSESSLVETARGCDMPTILLRSLTDRTYDVADELDEKIDELGLNRPIKKERNPT